MERLQSVQNSTAQLVIRTHKHQHIAPVFNSVLDFQSYTGMVYAYKALHGAVPQYQGNLFII